MVLAEFWQGATRAGHPPELVESFLALGVPIVDATPVIPVYARLAAELQSAPEWRAIGQNDLWIASTALAHGAPLLTRNRRHFDRMPGLRLVVGEPA